MLREGRQQFMENANTIFGGEHDTGLILAGGGRWIVANDKKPSDVVMVVSDVGVDNSTPVQVTSQPARHGRCFPIGTCFLSGLCGTRHLLDGGAGIVGADPTPALPESMGMGENTLDVPRQICTLASWSRSRVGVTTPSVEFSIGTTP